jgi:molybdopterin-containing oxidoreductase family iron-sulfur binding subunit
MRRVRQTIYLSREDDETSRRSGWCVPAAHFLEYFSDALASDGTVSMIQPLIAPLYGGVSAHEILARLADEKVSDYEIVRGHWKKEWGETGFESRWRRALHDGVVAGSSRKKVALPQVKFPEPELTSPQGLEAVFRPDPSIWDGSFANNVWLQELPKPMTKLTWDNAALIAPELAARHGLSNGAVIRIEGRGRSIEAPVWIVPGQAQESVVLPLGYGRTGRIARGHGFKAGKLRVSQTPFILTGVRIAKTGKKTRLSSTQEHRRMEGRALALSAGRDEFIADPHWVHRRAHSPESASLYPPFVAGKHRWAMAIDLNACIGCSSCVIACQSENNTPNVGKKEVAKGREMHWLRVDDYAEDEAGDVRWLHQPVPCMHCENAPCEPVCPVAATTHSPDGINQMIYNRCVGTRYCSNNCPYKVRRFNFYEYADKHAESLRLMRNPDVTVRTRGVMEKCTFCIQRLNQATIEEKKSGRRFADGEVKTACQAACPTGAIVFGDWADPSSRVSVLKKNSLHYLILAELNVRPRVGYLGKILNPGAGETSGGPA